MTNRLNVVVLFGGRSSEHSISCVTAAGILGAIDTERFSVIPVGITKEGAFTLVSERDMNYALDQDPLPSVSDNGTRVEWPQETSSRELMLRKPDGTVESLGNIDVVFPMLHGPYGEDGTVQGLLELVSIPYVGSGVLASSVCMDKHVSKTLFQAAGIRVAPWRTITRVDYDRDPNLTGLIDHLEYPLFVKPSRAGSSVGVSRVTDSTQLPAALEIAFAEDHMVLIESGIAGREVEIAVLEGRGNDLPRASSVIGEIVFQGKEFYDFEAKYLGSDGVDIVLPTEVSDEDYLAIRDAATVAFTVAQCSGPARVDFFLTEEGPVLNEINTMPGFTPISMYPQLWEQSGLSYRDLITELIELAQEAVR